MRDNHEGLVEIIDAFEEGGHYCGLVQIEREREQRCFRFGVDRDGYSGLRKIFQFRPFDQMAGVPHRYFFVTATRLNNGSAMMKVRVEQGERGKQMEVESSYNIAANLRWFYELDDWSKAQHLVVK